MKDTTAYLWRFLHYGAIALLIIGMVISIVVTDTSVIRIIIVYSARFGMLALALTVAMKNVSQVHKWGENGFVDVLKKQMRWQREQGLIAFHAFALHVVATTVLVLYHGQFTLNEYGYILFSALIPCAVLVYLFLTSFRPIQKRVRGWKRTHTIIWIIFGTVLAHEYLVSQMIQITTILATVIAIGSTVYGLIVHPINQRIKRQVMMIIIGFILMAVVLGMSPFVRSTFF